MFKQLTIAMTALTIYTGAFPMFENTSSTSVNSQETGNFDVGQIKCGLLRQNIQEIIDGKTTILSPGAQTLETIDEPNLIEFLQHPNAETITHIDLAPERFTDAFIADFAKILNSLPNLTNLSLCDHTEEATNTQPLLNALRTNTTIQSLNLMIPINAAAFISVLQNNATLTNISISVSLSSPQHIQQLADLLAENHFVQSLTIYPQTAVADALPLFKSLEKDITLKSFSIALYRAITSQESQALCEMLKKNHSLRRLWIPEILAQEHVDTLAEILKTSNYTIETLGGSMLNRKICALLARNKQFNQIKDQ